MSQSNSNTTIVGLRHLLTCHAAAVGLGIRVVVAYIFPVLLDDARWIPGVAYTDIDYHVFLDAATHVQNGQSPYERHTYRYTPFLAYLLSQLPNMRFTARYVFCVADTLCGVLIVRLRQQQRRPAQQPQDDNSDNNEELSDALWWLYNPFAINICTRGSAEALVLLPVLLTIHLLLKIKESTAHNSTKCTNDSGNDPSSSLSRTARLCAVIWAGMCHGLAIHAKLYPVTYTLSYAAYLAPSSSSLSPPTTYRKRPSSASSSFSAHVLVGWIQRLLTPLPILFGGVSVLTFAGLTYLSYAWYGPVSLQEGLLYHVGRVDHRHNYSMFWYPIYLNRAAGAAAASALTSSSYLAVASKLLFVPQAVLLAYTSLGIAPRRLPLALFVQTFLFVTMNKVITAQYFTWYLVLLPLCSTELLNNGWNQMRTRRRLQLSVTIFGASIVLWLGSAYCLEMQGMAVHRHVWVASVLFFGASVNLLGALLSAAAAEGHGRGIGSGCDDHQKKAPNKID